MSPGARSSPGVTGTQMRPSLRSDSLIRVVLDCQWEDTGNAVGWNWMKLGLAKRAPRRWARHVAVAFEFIAKVEWKKTLP